MSVQPLLQCARAFTFVFLHRKMRVNIAAIRAAFVFGSARQWVTRSNVTKLVKTSCSSLENVPCNCKCSTFKEDCRTLFYCAFRLCICIKWINCSILDVQSRRWPHQPQKTEANLIIKKKIIICEEKNTGYRIIELICYCFLTNLGN